MQLFVSALLLAAALGLIWAALRRQEQKRRRAPGPAGVLEYRTALPLDDCFDRLRTHEEADLFAYTCERQPDGAFVLHFTLHRPTNQPLDTVFLLRLDPGRKTVVTLSFVREAFGYREPVFPQEMLDEFLAAKLDAAPTGPAASDGQETPAGQGAE